MLPTLLLLLTSVQAGPPDITAAPQFLASRAFGVIEDPRLPVTWSAKKNVVWATDLPGRGWSSPVMGGERVFLTSVVNDKTPPAKKGLYIENVFGKPIPGEHRWLLHCLDFQTGKVLWEKEVHRGEAPQAIHIKNTYASETPVTDGRQVYAYFGNLGLFCYNLDGELKWSKKWPPVKTRLGWGTAASPVLHRGRLYIVNDNEERSFLTAIDTSTGKEVWTVSRQEKSSWATPFIWENELRTEIVTAASGRVRSYALDGKLLWELDGMSSIAIPTPTAAHGLLYVSSGYVGDGRRRPVFAIRPGGSGDISLKEGESSNQFIAWLQKFAGPYHPSPLVYGDHVYVLYDRGFLSCFDARTGKQIYDRQRLPGGAFTASPWAYNGKLFCLDEDGKTYVVQTGPAFKLLGENELNGAMTLATPAIVRGSLILRAGGTVYRLQQGKN